MSRRRSRIGQAPSQERHALPFEPPSPPVRWLWRAAVVLALVAAIAVIVASKSGRDAAAGPGAAPAITLAASHAAPDADGIPRLVDVGADRCIPCKAMAPILAELRTEYAGRMQVEFIDVWKNPGAGEPYRVYMIPTQVFYGSDGRELGRHQGFISKADILATWQRHGYDFASPAATATKN